MASPTGQAGHGKYPKQIVTMVDEATDTRLRDEAARNRLSLSEVTRTYIELGMQSADSMVGTRNVEHATPPYLVG